MDGVKVFIALAALSMAGCREAPVRTEILEKVHAVGCAPGGYVDVISPDGALRSLNLFGGYPKCETWNYSTWWRVHLHYGQHPYEKDAYLDWMGAVEAAKHPK